LDVLSAATDVIAKAIGYTIQLSLTLATRFRYLIVGPHATLEETGHLTIGSHSQYGGEDHFYPRDI
jgi:hypothetical protein